MSGVIKHEQEVAKNSFAMKLCCLVEAEGCTGYVADVCRELDLKEGYGLWTCALLSACTENVLPPSAVCCRTGTVMT